MILFNLHKKRWWYNDTHLDRRPKGLSSISCSGLIDNACKSHLEGLLRRRSWATLPLSKSVGLGGDWELFQTRTQTMVVMLAQGPTFANPFLRGRSGIQTRWEVFYMSLPIAFPTHPNIQRRPCVLPLLENLLGLGCRASPITSCPSQSITPHSAIHVQLTKTNDEVVSPLPPAVLSPGPQKN